MYQRYDFLLLFLCILILIVSSCCSNEKGNDDSTIPDEGTLTLFGSTPVTLDPAIARSADSMQYLAEIFSGLVTFDHNLDLVPDIAERWERLSGGEIYLFHLRQDVRFHNGREVTADDIKYSWERACDPATGSQTAETYLGDIIGVQEVLDGNATAISGIKVINDYLLQVTIDAPKEYFLSKLAYPTAFVVDQHNVESRIDWWRNPNGTGPFKLDQWSSSNIILQRNNSYYLDKANIERAVFYLSGGIPMMMYENGEIDITGVSLNDIDRVLDPENSLNDELVVTPMFNLNYVGFNCSTPPFDDPKIRKAFSHAIDKDKLVDLTLKGMVIRADGIIPPGMPGYNKYLRGLDFDIDKALKLIDDSKYSSVSNFPPVALTSSGRGSVSNIEAALVDMWRENLGIEVSINLWQPDTFPYIITEKKDELFLIGWSADYPDPHNFLDVLFRTGQDNNFGEYSNVMLDKRLDEAAVEEDHTARIQAYYLAEQDIVDNAACIPLFFDVSYILVKPYVKNFPDTALGIPRLKYVYIDNA